MEHPQQEPDLDNRDRTLVEALAAGLTHQEAADQAGFSSKTVQRRLGDAIFTQALRERRAERLDQLATGLEASAATALEALDGLLRSESESVRLSAVRVALTEHVRYRSTHEHEARLFDLEAAAAKLNSA